MLLEAADIYAEVNLPGDPVSAYPHVSLAGIYSRLGLAEPLAHHSEFAQRLLRDRVAQTILRCSKRNAFRCTRYCFRAITPPA